MESSEQIEIHFTEIETIKGPDSVKMIDNCIIIHTVTLENPFGHSFYWKP